MSCVSKILKDLEKSKNSTSFFNSLLKQKGLNEFQKILSDIVLKTSSYNAIKSAIFEINRRNLIYNLESLVDFVVLKKCKDYDFNSQKLEELKVLAIKTIGKYKNNKFVPKLISCLNDENESNKVRLYLAETLGQIGDSIAVIPLIDIVQNEVKSVYLRESAVRALGMIGDIRAVETFVNFLTNSDSMKEKFKFLKENMIEAFQYFPIKTDNRVIKILSDALYDKTKSTRLNALEAISNTNCTYLINEVQNLLDDSDEEIVEGAVITLYNLSGSEILFEILNSNYSEIAKKTAKEILDEYD